MKKSLVREGGRERGGGGEVGNADSEVNSPGEVGVGGEGLKWVGRSMNCEGHLLKTTSVLAESDDAFP